MIWIFYIRFLHIIAILFLVNKNLSCISCHKTFWKCSSTIYMLHLDLFLDIKLNRNWMIVNTENLEISVLRFKNYFPHSSFISLCLLPWKELYNIHKTNDCVLKWRLFYCLSRVIGPKAVWNNRLITFSCKYLIIAPH